MTQHPTLLFDGASLLLHFQFIFSEFGILICATTNLNICMHDLLVYLLVGFVHLISPIKYSHVSPHYTITTHFTLDTFFSHSPLFSHPTLLTQTPTCTLLIPPSPTLHYTFIPHFPTSLPTPLLITSLAFALHHCTVLSHSAFHTSSSLLNTPFL